VIVSDLGSHVVRLKITEPGSAQSTRTARALGESDASAANAEPPLNIVGLAALRERT
jgi:hypothetical protein